MFRNFTENPNPTPTAPAPLNPVIREESRRRMSNCLSAMIRAYPFFGHLALRMPLREDSARPSMAADGQYIYYNPGWVSQQTADHLRYAVARLTMACALKHHVRRGDRDYALWNQASRLVTQYLLKDSGLQPNTPYDQDPQSGTDTFGLNMPIEQAYELLRRLAPPQDQGSNSSQQSPNGQSQSAGSAGSNRQQPDNSSRNEPGGSAGQQRSQASANNQAGSGSSQPQQQEQQQTSAPGPQAPSHNQNQTPAGNRNQSPQPNQPSPENTDPNGHGEVMDHPAAHNQEDRQSNLKTEEQRWDTALHTAQAFAKSQGNMPGSMSQAIAAMHDSQVNWRELLRRFMYAQARRDYTWSQPNRRLLSLGYYLPALNAEGMPPLVLAIDTSGSMSEPELAQVWGEIRQLAGELEPERVHIIQCDTRISAAEEYLPGELPLELEAKGRGGTQFSPVFRHVEDELNADPACLIYCTDLYCYDYPEPPPNYPVLWLVTGDPKPTQDPPFGERIDLDFPSQESAARL